MNDKKIKKFRKEIHKAVSETREEIEQEIKTYINNAPFLDRIKFAGRVLAGRV